MTDSVRNEYDSIQQNHHARILSRIGFVSEDLKDFQSEIITAIDEHAAGIGNNAQCIVNAHQELAAIEEAAGLMISTAARDWLEELHLMEDNFIKPFLKELDLLTSQFDIEILNVIRYYNPVTNTEMIVGSLLLEVMLFEYLFEFFVSEIFIDFIIFEEISNNKNLRIFPALSEGVEDFRSAGRLIIDSLASCT